MMRSMNDRMTSENPRGVRLRHVGGEPDDQQERLITTGWVIGFVDGEGCFSIGVARPRARPERDGYLTRYQLAHEFAVTQGAKSEDSLRDLQDFFRVGQVIPNRRHDNHREGLWRYVVRRRRDLLEVVIPFFQQHPLRTAKASDFQKFATCVAMMGRGEHLQPRGLIQIFEIMQTMNRQKPRFDVIRILRDQTPDTRESE